jgi:uncharacterized protein YdhG (YjbR/CyaY superfamily)
MPSKKYANISEYIKDFPKPVQLRLEKIRSAIKKEAPMSEEIISYNMPAFKQKKTLVYFAAYKLHIGFYALPSGTKAFQKEVALYKTGKGSIQFPHDQPLPIDLITKIVAFRIKEINEKEKSKLK